MLNSGEMCSSGLLKFYHIQGFVIAFFGLIDTTFVQKTVFFFFFMKTLLIGVDKSLRRIITLMYCWHVDSGSPTKETPLIAIT